MTRYRVWWDAQMHVWQASHDTAEGRHGRPMAGSRTLSGVMNILARRIRKHAKEAELRERRRAAWLLTD